jgi:hypothetical protein
MLHYDQKLGRGLSLSDPSQLDVLEQEFSAEPEKKLSEPIQQE